MMTKAISKLVRSLLAKVKHYSIRSWYAIRRQLNSDFLTPAEKSNLALNNYLRVISLLLQQTRQVTEDYYVTWDNELRCAHYVYIPYTLYYGTSTYITHHKGSKRWPY